MDMYPETCCKQGWQATRRSRGPGTQKRPNNSHKCIRRSDKHKHGGHPPKAGLAGDVPLEVGADNPLQLSELHQICLDYVARLGNLLLLGGGVTQAQAKATINKINCYMHATESFLNHNVKSCTESAEKNGVNAWALLLYRLAATGHRVRNAAQSRN